MSSDQQFSENQTEKKEETTALTGFCAQFDAEPEVERKLRMALDFMRTAISQTQSPRFKDFWEGRRLCLPLFKAPLNPKSRSVFWAEYIELSQEARRLKEILDEQSAFAAEQIELAIAAIESDLEHYEAVLSQVPVLDCLEESEILHKKRELYDALQRELNLLNTLASRVNALRKEVIKTDMRIRHKNRFFERLSAIGDRVFPQRKELIKKISDEFTRDVEDFIRAYFGEQQEQNVALFALREEIKVLQSIAKVLTLNTQAFTETRLRLSHCWDELKERDKERKKEVAVMKMAFKQNYDAVLEKIKPLAETIAEGTLSLEESAHQVDQILEYMQSIELGREEVRALREELQKARKPILDKIRQEEMAKEEHYRELERQKKEKIEQLKTKLNQLLEQAEAFEHEALIAAQNELSKECESLTLNKLEKQQIDRLFKLIKEEIKEKREKAILNLSEDDLRSLEQLREILEERREERQEIKTQLENYRKALGGSGFDFEKAMTYRETIEAEKARLEKVNALIDEIEDKIAEFEG